MSKERERALEILRRLVKEYPDAPPTYLMFSSPFQMLIATILSARATDAGVNKATPELFGKYPDPESLANADIDSVAKIIRSCGTYNRKSAYIKATAAMLVKDFGGEVPKTLDKLIRLPGVNRKTANVVLQVIFGQAEGVVVDTHVMRVSVRLGLSQHDKKPDKVEKDLMQVLPKNKWIDYGRFIGAHGRRTCKSASPRCSTCPINALCPSAGLFN